MCVICEQTDRKRRELSVAIEYDSSNDSENRDKENWKVILTYCQHMPKATEGMTDKLYNYILNQYQQPSQLIDKTRIASVK